MAKNKVFYKSISKAILDLTERRRKKSVLNKILFYAVIAFVVIFAAVSPSYIMEYFSCTPFLACLPSFILLGLVFFGGYYRKKLAVRRFMKVENIDDKVNFIELTDSTTLSDFKRFYEDDTWIFGSRKEDIIPFIYNWFLTAGVINNDTKFNAYYLKMDVIKSKFKRKSEKDDNIQLQAKEVCLLSISEFDFTDDQLEKISEEASCVKPFQFESWLNKYFVVPSFFNEDDEETEEAAEGDATGEDTEA